MICWDIHELECAVAVGRILLEHDFDRIAISIARSTVNMAVVSEIRSDAGSGEPQWTGKLCAVARDAGVLQLDEFLKCVPEGIRDVLRPFPRAEGLDAKQQWSLLTSAIRRFSSATGHNIPTKKLALPDGEGKLNQKKRGAWRDAWWRLCLHRERLSEADRFDDGSPKRRSWLIRKAPYIAALADHDLLAEFVRSRHKKK